MATKVAEKQPEQVKPAVDVLVFRPTTDLGKSRHQNEVATLAIHPHAKFFAGGDTKAAIYYADGTVDSPGVPYTTEHELYQKLSGLIQNVRDAEERKIVQLQKSIQEAETKKLGTAVSLQRMRDRLKALEGGVIYAAQHIKKITDKRDVLYQGRITGTKSVSMPDRVTVLPFSSEDEIKRLNNGYSVDPLKDRIMQTFGERIWIEVVKPLDVMPYDQQRRQYLPEWVIL